MAWNVICHIYGSWTQIRALLIRINWTTRPLPLHSEWCLESNHGLRYYLYYVCLIFDFARDVASSNGRRWIFKFLKRRRWSLARERSNQDETRVCNPLTSISIHTCTLAQLVKTLPVGRCSPMPWVRTPSGPDLLSFYKLCIFSIFYSYLYFI